MYENDNFNDNNTTTNYVKSVKLAKIHYSDSKSFWLGFLCFLCPYVGFFSYIVWKDDRPKRATSCLAGAMIGFFVPIILLILCIIGYILAPEIFEPILSSFQA